MKNQSKRTYLLAVSAVTGAAYAVMTMALAPISYGAIQLRVSEALCILPFFIPGTAWGLFAGCAVANILTGNIFDIVFGSLATLAAGLLTAAAGRRGHSLACCALACLMPVLLNALVVGAVITGAYIGVNIFEAPGVYAITAAQVGAGEAIVLYVLGLPLMRWLEGNRRFREMVIKAS